MCNVTILRGMLVWHRPKAAYKEFRYNLETKQATLIISDKTIFDAIKADKLTGEALKVVLWALNRRNAFEKGKIKSCQCKH